jgi:hypothetical protein
MKLGHYTILFSKKMISHQRGEKQNKSGGVLFWRDLRIDAMNLPAVTLTPLCWGEDSSKNVYGVYWAPINGEASGDTREKA